MIGDIYTIPNGLCGKHIQNKWVLGLLIVILCTVYFYIIAYFKITWTGEGTPSRITFDERDISIVLYSSTLAILFYIVFALQIVWLSSQSTVFFNRTTMSILFATRYSGTKLYTYFLIKRLFELFVLNTLFVSSLVLIYLIRDNNLVFSLIENIGVLFLVSAFIVLIFDLVFYFSVKSPSSAMVTFFLIIIISLFNFALRPLLGPSEYSDMVNFIPDLLSITYQYLLLSFDGSYSAKQMYYPLATLVVILFFTFRISSRMPLLFSR